MKSYNNVTLVGKVVNDATIRIIENEISSAGDSKRATFTLAIDRPFKDKNGETLTDFLNIVAWGKLAEICGDYIIKGSTILISGRVQSRSYTVNDEIKWITEIVAETVNVMEYANKGGR